jgi:hypothetical protein
MVLNYIRPFPELGLEAQQYLGQLGKKKPLSIEGDHLSFAEEGGRFEMMQKIDDHGLINSKGTGMPCLYY